MDRWRLVGFFALAGCSAGIPRNTLDQNLSAEQVPLIRADSEVFAALIHARVESGADTVLVNPKAEIDSRPWGEGKRFHDVAGGGTGYGSPDLAYKPDSSTLALLAENRKKILRASGRREGKGFSYPRCGGTLAPPPPPPAPGDTSARRTDIHGGCPATDEGYVNVGIPLRGIPEGFKKARQPIEISGDVWTVVINNHYVGPGGQNWFQSAVVLRRDPASGQLRIAKTVLLSWAE